MVDYVEREAAVKIAEKYGLANGSVLGRHTGLADCIASEIAILPATNVAPAVHGKWERVANSNWPAHIHDKCNICGWWNTRNALCYDGRKGHSLNYCPNCGAKMDGGADHEAD